MVVAVARLVQSVVFLAAATLVVVAVVPQCSDAWMIVGNTRQSPVTTLLRSSSLYNAYHDDGNQNDLPSTLRSDTQDHNSKVNHQEPLTTTTTTNAAGTVPPPPPPQRIVPFRGALSMSIAELAIHLGGVGRAKLVWDCYTMGIDPAIYFASADADADDADTTGDDNERIINKINNVDITKLFPGNRRNQRLGENALQRLAMLYTDYYDDASTTTSPTTPTTSQTRTRTRKCGVQDGVATLLHVSQSQDLTTKLLLQLHDGTAVETVIIPWDTTRSTLCISSQVGCQQACTFCATGRMGKVRSLTTDEILVQMFFAQKFCVRSQQLSQQLYHHDSCIDSTTHSTMIKTPLPPITNVVFMGMGEPADNMDAVVAATIQLTDRTLFQLSAQKVTVSTVAPTPDAFLSLSKAPCVLAWSVHAARDDLRRKLVPTTKYPMVQLRQGLIDALLLRPYNVRTTMLEVALIDKVNDSLEEAEEMADFVRAIYDAVPGSKVMVNLIPWNDIGGGLGSSVHPLGYRKPSPDRVEAYQRHLWSRGVYTHVRTTRGDDESAACGQLATQKQRRRHTQQQQFDETVPIVTTA